MHIRSLRYKVTIKAIKTAIANLPRGSSSLDTAYEEALDSIDNQPKDLLNLAKGVFTWMLYSERQLTCRELQHVIAVEVSSAFDKDNIPELEDIITVSTGLLTRDEKSDIIRFAHYTVQAFLDGKRDSWLPNGHSTLSDACITYLNRTDLTSIQKAISYSDAEPLPLRSYAATYWGMHARKATSSIDTDELVSFFQDKERINAAYQILTMSNGTNGKIKRRLATIHAIHLVSCIGPTEHLQLLLDSSVSPITEDNSGMTCLHYAALWNRKDNVEAFLDRRPVSGGESNSVSSKQEVKVLNKRDHLSMTPLLCAVESGSEAVVRILLDEGANANGVGGPRSSTPLWLALYYLREEMIRDSVASRHKVLDAVLEHHANVNTTDYKGEPLIMMALDDSRSLEKLLAWGADPNQRGSGFETALHRFTKKAINGSSLHWNVQSMIEALLYYGADIDVVDNEGSTPLLLSCAAGNAQLVRLLVSRGADVNKASKSGINPLVIAHARLHWTAVEACLEYVTETDEQIMLIKRALSKAKADGRLQLPTNTFPQENMTWPLHYSSFLSFDPQRARELPHSSV